MGDRIPERPARPAMIKIYSVRVTGPTTDMEETQVHGLSLDHVVTVLLMLQVGDSATIDCTTEIAGDDL